MTATQLGHVLWQMFDWPNGNVLGNLIASLIWALPALAHLHWRLSRQEARLLARGLVAAAQDFDRLLARAPRRTNNCSGNGSGRIARFRIRRRRVGEHRKLRRTKS